MPENQSRTLDSNPRASKQAPISDILQAYKNGTLGKQSIQRECVEDEELLQSKRSGQAPVNVILQRYEESIQRNVPEEDEELLQGKFDTARRTEIGIDEEKLLQGKFESDIQTEQEPIQREEKSNNTGLPNNLKTGVENLSGYSMDDVKVHYNSDKPVQLNALAYAQGTDIHIGPGQENHLPHEAWHVVQQKQGCVEPTMQMLGVQINDNKGLEVEADVMGGKASNNGNNTLQKKENSSIHNNSLILQKKSSNDIIQRMVGFEFETLWDIKKKSDMAWDTNTPLVQGKNWQMSPDEIKGNGAKIEFKTAPFNVDGPDVEDLAVTIKDSFSSLNTYITSNLLPLNKNEFSPLPTVITTAQNVEVKPMDDLVSKPQVTGGIRTDLLFDFFKDLTVSKEKGDLMPGSKRKSTMQNCIDIIDPMVDEDSTKHKEFGATIILLSYYVRRFQEDKRIFDESNNSLRDKFEKYFEDFKLTAHEEEIENKRKELLALYEKKKVELLNKITPSYAKARASVLSRIAFNDLPHVKTKTLLKHVLKAAGLKETDGNLYMFPLGFKHYPGVEYTETIAEWIESIQQERGDTEGELWSARALAPGPVGYGEARGTGIPFELRSLPGNLPYNEWFNFAKPYVDYFRRLNTKDKPSEE